MSRRRRLFLTALANGVRYFVRDSFITPLTAGNVNGTASEPGPGLRVVNDSAGTRLSITGGRVVTTGYTAGGDPRVILTDNEGNGFARQAGLTMKWTGQWVTGRSGLGWVTSATPNNYPLYGATDLSGQLTVFPPYKAGDIRFTTGADYTIWVTLFATGAAIWAQGGTGSYLYSDPVLLWVSDNGTQTPLWPAVILARSGAGDCQIQADTAEVVMMSDRASAEAIATVYEDAPANGINQVTFADAQTWLHTLTLNPSPSAGEKIELRYRMSDVLNYFALRVVRNAGNTAWDINWVKVTAGVEADMVAAITGAGTVTDLKVIAEGNNHRAYYRVGGIWQHPANVVDAHNATATECGAWYDTDFGATRLESYAWEWGA